MKEKLI